MDLDRIVHEPARLRILTILSGLDVADFTFLCTTLGLTKGNLSSHMDRLEKAGYIEVQKSFNGKIPHTDYRLTGAGREGLAEYWSGLDAIRALKDKGQPEPDEAGDTPPTGGEGENAVDLQISTPAFDHNASIPAQYTGDGRDVSPPLCWADPPDGTVSFALINDDPDAPVGTWVHWVVYDIPADARGLPEALPADGQLDDGVKQGMTDFGRIGYGGPAPPRGPEHRYFFKLYALDTQLALPPGSTKKQVLSAMAGHVLAETELVGRYKR